MEMTFTLHITDLHIDDPVSGPELLRKGKYKEYLGDLAHTIRANGISSLHAAAVTGDFVNCGKTGNLAHAGDVVGFLLAEFGLKDENAAMCLGNHDVDRALEQAGKFSESRKPVNEFMSRFANGTRSQTVDSVRDRAVLCRPSPGIWCLMLDSLLGCDKAHAPDPGKLNTPTESDGILELVQAVPQDALLVIGTHYTVDASVGRQAAWEDEQPDWYNRHVWTDCTPVKERIQRVRRVPGNTIWLCGDIHREGSVCVGGVSYITTGRLGTRSTKSESPILRQATVVEHSERGIRLLKATYSTSESRAEYGDWKAEWVDLPRDSGSLTGVAAKGTTTDPSKVTPTSADRDRIVSPLSATAGQQKRVDNVTLISAEMEEDILKSLRDKRLYVWGRFETSGSEVLLSWISVGPLLNVPGRLGAAVNQMGKWLSSQLAEKTITTDRVLLIGVDCWGAVLASQLSIVLNVQNYCIAARGRGEYHTIHESIGDDVQQAVAQSQAVVLVNDVVATGHTQLWVYEKLCAGLDAGIAKELTWLSLSVFTDPDQPLAADCSFIASHGTACRIKRPFLSADRVPGDDLVPTQISFI
jgi:hypothetical protein